MPFFINDVFNSEGNTGTTAFTFTVTRTNPIGSASVDYTTAPAITNSATAGVDFVATSGTLNFLPGETTKTITVLVNGDTTFEPDEFFNVILSNAIGDTIGDTTGMGGVRNDDAALPTVSILPTASSTQLEGNSGTTAFTFTVALSTSTTQPITVNYSTNDGTAISSSDYQDNDGTLTFVPGGPLTQTITVLVNGDTQLEPTETFTVSLNSATNANISSSAGVAVGTIVNNDLVYTLTASNPTPELEGDSNSTLRTFVITRDGSITQASSLNLVLAGSATLGTDYTLNGVTGTGVSLSGNTIQFAAGATTAVITLAVQGDTQIEPDETILLSLTDPTGVATIAGSPLSTTIVNDDFAPVLPIVSISVSDGDVAEAGNNPGTFTITRTGDTSEALTVNYTISGTATNGTDYTPALTGTATIPAGQDSVTVTITPGDDLNIEGNETVGLTLTNSATYTLGVATAAVTIVDNDFLPPPLPTISIAATDPNAAEAGTDPGTFTITRTGDTSEALTVLYTVDGTATSGIDYASLVQTATIPAGQSSVEVTIVPTDDADVEGNETVNLTLIEGSAYDLSGTTTATVTITDNDSFPLPTVSITALDPDAAEAGNNPGTFTIERTGDTSEALTVSYTVGGTAAIDGTDYTPPLVTGTVTIPAGQSSVNVTITPIDDLTVEGNETVDLTLTSSAGYNLNVATASVTITDNDSSPPPLPTVRITATDGGAAEAGTDPGTFTITRTGDTSQALTVSYAISGSASNGTDYTAIAETVTIPAGESSVNVTITPIDDVLIEGSETVSLNLVSTPGYTIETAAATVTITDNDTAGVTITPIAGLITTEAGGTATFAVQLATQPLSDVIINLSSSNLAEGTISTPALIFTPTNWNLPQTITVTGVDDPVVDGDIAYTIVTAPIVSTDPNYQGLDPVDLAVTNLDNDELLPPPLPTLNINQVSLTEGNSGTTAFTFTVSLSAASSSIVTVEYATVDGLATALSDYTAIPLTTLTFAPGQTSQTITVNVQGDLEIEGDETFFVNLSNASGATIAIAQGTGTILNDDAPVVVNAPPIALDDQTRVTEGQTVTIAVLDNDSDPDSDPLTIDSFTNPQFGTLVRNNDGTFTYQANLDFAGTDSFTYQISDGQGGVGQATVVITIDPLNLIGTECCDRLIGTNTGNRIEGRGGNDWIEGRGGDDWLNGEAGWDTLMGGLGADQFVFDSGSAFTPCSLGVDMIVDFDRSQGDAIVLSRTTFTALSSLVGNSLTPNDFAVIDSACNGATLAAASVARIVFNQATGDLFYNQNGSCCGFGSGGRFATLSVNSSTTPLQASDFRVIA